MSDIEHGIEVPTTNNKLVEEESLRKRRVDPPGDSDDDDEEKINTKETTTISFIDYIPPPSKPVPPPAKYKLWIMITTLVYFAQWIAVDSGYQEWISTTFHVNPATAGLFIMLGTIVACLVYGGFDVLTKVIQIKIGNTWYGVPMWLKQPRTAPMINEYNKTRKYVLLDILEMIVAVFEDGFGIFNIPRKPGQQGGPPSTPSTPTQGGPPSTPRQNGPPEQPKPKNLDVDHDHHDHHEESAGGRVFDYSYEGADEEHDVVLRIITRADPKKRIQYKKWRERFVIPYTDKSPGLKNVRTETLLVEDQLKQKQQEQNDVHNDDGLKGDIHTTYLTFDNVDYLNMFMTSPVRARLVKNLQPLLLQPTTLQLVKNRALPDAFTDLHNRQGSGVPFKPPYKWKVWWITTLGLYCVILLTSRTLGFYFNEWRLNDVEKVPIRGSMLVRLTINTFLSSYIAAPFLTLLFGHWINQRNDHISSNQREPWRTLNNGFTTFWCHLLVFLAFYGTCIIAIYVKKTK